MHIKIEAVVEVLRADGTEPLTPLEARVLVSQILRCADPRGTVVTDNARLSVKAIETFSSFVWNVGNEPGTVVCKDCGGQKLCDRSCDCFDNHAQ